ncbi:MAG TPA: hypothetical protein V6C58_08190 [Allocoleopsis sp.]
MESGTNTIDLSRVSFPVYSIGYTKPVIEGGVSLYISFNSETGEPSYSIIDDTTIPKDTLAQRRLHLLSNNIKLKKLGKAIFFIGDLVKLAYRTKWFIDSKGTIFQYKKSSKVNLTFHKIDKLIRIPTGGAIVELVDFPGRFKSLFYPHEQVFYAGILHSGMSHILYGLYADKPKDTKRYI